MICGVTTDLFVGMICGVTTDLLFGMICGAGTDLFVGIICATTELFVGMMCGVTTDGLHCVLLVLLCVLFLLRVGQNHIFTMYIRYFWQRNH